MQLEAIACPNCTAPLHLSPGQTLTVCLYCNATIRAQASAASPAVENTLSPADMEQIKRLVGHGRQAEAIQLYQQQTGANAADAAAVIQNLGRELAVSIIFAQTLRPFGVLFVILCGLVLIASLAAGLAGMWPWWVVLLFVGFATLNLLLFQRGIRNTIKYWRAPVAPATVLKIAPIGQIKKRGQTIHTMRALLSVRPINGAAFQTEMTFPVRERNLPRAQPGLELLVKYKPDAPQSVIYHGESKSSSFPKK